VTLDFMVIQDSGARATERVASRTEETKEWRPMSRLRTWRLPLLLAPRQELGRDEQAQSARSLETLTPVQGLFQSVLTQASREATP
jgi:hypothetical protein